VDALGYSLTWKTCCFIGCGKTVYAHTNGHRDFVLFDQLGWPWPIHDCYFDRFDLGGGKVNVAGSRDVPYSGTLTREWDSVTPITANVNGPRRQYDFIGTITNIEKEFVGGSPDFHGLPRISKEEVRKVLIGRTSLVTIVTGDGAEFTAFVDLKKTPLRFRDIVATDVKAARLLNRSVFVVNKIRLFGRDN